MPRHKPITVTMNLNAGEWQTFFSEMELAVTDNPDFRKIFDRIVDGHEDTLRTRQLANAQKSKHGRRIQSAHRMTGIAMVDL